ncbi:hypothetical protein COOONC_21403 [Cooperia oncophora]
MQDETRLIRRLGIADVTSVSLFCLFRINSETNGLGPQFGPLLQVASVIACSSFAAHMFGNMLIAVNRYSALRLKERYEKVWNRRNVRLIIGLQYGCAFAAFIPLFISENTFIQNEDGTYLYMGVDRRSDLVSFSYNELYLLC